MKRIIEFSKAFRPTLILSAVLIVAGMAGYFVKGGFNLGVDFQAGLMQEIQLAPTAFKMTYIGKGVASASLEKDRLDIVVSGSDVDKATHAFSFSQYPTVGALAAALSTVDGLSAGDVRAPDASSSWLLTSAGENPRLGSTPSALHLLKPDAEPVSIEKVRQALAPVASAAVQSLGKGPERKFMIRVQDQGTTDGFAKATTENIASALAATFGDGEVAVSRTDYVGSRFSKNLTDQAFMLVSLTLVLIFVYALFRFKASYAAGAVLAIMHDALIMIAFIAWTRMEFNTITIAAILTILGYSINDTIVIFDRIRETVRLYPEDPFKSCMNRAITETLGRTFITTITTMLAVMSLFLFTSGSMKDFALALLIGMISGTYSTIYIASAVVYYWDEAAKKRAVRAPKVKTVTSPQKA
ncbi:MAG: protein-export membrane protein SecF [Treponema sp. GWB1_62_6]|nr:MAG: protein-export membrane protein SecF [Treponema sp. GWC1_61_84]OHE65767.1 MAG: protein-export membrane protein SecF [Treponema sp. GWA1_62_8]OHE68431.1 MAG: protein-export membrane protein SecF [Treponema sp. RIFOXYC1_FULL_61_9]OHE70448.1 MAG: protein-export membrane protein SecF [Treponema sp. GWB1_62_6]HCM27235.1 protein translocase subunit SecF [Treponema sp.]